MLKIQLLTAAAWFIWAMLQIATFVITGGDGLREEDLLPERVRR